MKPYFILYIIILIFSPLSVEIAGNDYTSTALELLEKNTPVADWAPAEKQELVSAFSRNKIAIQTIVFITRNMPEDFWDRTAGDTGELLLAMSREMDIILKKGFQQVKAKYYFRNYLNTLKENQKGDSQKQKKMLNSLDREGSDNIENQYRYRQLNRYRSDKEEQQTGGGNSPGNQGGGNDPGGGNNPGNGEGNAGGQGPGNGNAGSNGNSPHKE